MGWKWEGVIIRRYMKCEVTTWGQVCYDTVEVRIPVPYYSHSTQR